MNQKMQLFIVQGGMTFKNNKDYVHYLKTRTISLEKKISWNDSYLEKKLGKNFEIILPRMPLQDNAKYIDWKIHFERYIPHLRNDVILIGSSLGGVFLAKYLSENKFPKRILATYLICPAFDNTLPTEDLVGGFTLKSDLSLLQKNSKQLTLLFSKNDEVVPLSHAKKYKKKLPNARIIIFETTAGHRFKISDFLKIIVLIKEDVKRK